MARNTRTKRKPSTRTKTGRRTANRKSTSRRGASKRRKFHYKERDPSKIKARGEQTGGRFDSPYKENADLFTPRQGENVLRFLPPTWEDPDHYGYDIWVHPYVGPDNSTYLCPRKMKNERCPICEAAERARKEGDDEEAKSLEPKQKLIAYVLDREGENPTQPMIWSMSWTMDRDIASLCHSKRTGKTLIIDRPDDGYDITLKRTGKRLNTRYHGIAIDREPSPISEDEDEQEEVLQYIDDNPLPDMLKFYDYKHLQGVLDGTNQEKDEDLDEDEDEEDLDEEDDEEEDEEDLDEEDDEEEDEEDLDEEDDEEEDEEDLDEEDDEEEDDEEEDDEEEEEEEKPRRRATKNHRTGSARPKRKPSKSTSRRRRR